MIQLNFILLYILVWDVQMPHYTPSGYTTGVNFTNVKRAGFAQTVLRQKSANLKC